MERLLHRQPILILGGGRGGFALLEMFTEDELVEVVAVIDRDPNAMGIKFAQFYQIPTYTNVIEGLEACKKYSDCIIYNLTHGDEIVSEVAQVFGEKKVTDGLEAKLFWRRRQRMAYFRQAPAGIP